jgi:hypothetical protein
MDCRPAVKVAIDLLHLPSQAALTRASALPDDILALLRIAAGDTEATNQAAMSEGRSPEMVREAAGFFLEQVLFHEDADSYRVLGSTSKASYPELRRNMALLLQWLHPDVDHGEARSVFTAKVTRAWNDLKTPERRAVYDEAQRLAKAKSSPSKHPTKMSSKKSLGSRRVHSSRRPHRYEDLRGLNPYTEFLRRVCLLLFGKFVR